MDSWHLNKSKYWNKKKIFRVEIQTNGISRKNTWDFKVNRICLFLLLLFVLHVYTQNWHGSVVEFTMKIGLVVMRLLRERNLQISIHQCRTLRLDWPNSQIHCVVVALLFCFVLHSSHAVCTKSRILLCTYVKLKSIHGIVHTDSHSFTYRK